MNLLDILTVGKAGPENNQPRPEGRALKVGAVL